MLTEVTILLSEDLTRPQNLLQGGSPTWLQFLLYVVLSTELLEDFKNMEARARPPKNQGRRCNVIYDLPLKVTHCHYHCILWVTEISLADSV